MHFFPREELETSLIRLSDVSYGPGLATKRAFQLTENSGLVVYLHLAPPSVLSDCLYILLIVSQGRSSFLLFLKPVVIEIYYQSVAG